MTKTQAIKILIHHNKWRRGDTNYPKFSPTEIGLAIDKAIELLTKGAKREKRRNNQTT